MRTVKYFTALTLSLLVFLACNNGITPGTDNDKNDNNNDTATIHVQNQSAATLVNLKWNGRSFGEGQAISRGGIAQIDNVKEWHSYLFFNIAGVGSDIALRTQALITKDEQNFTFVFTNNTPIVEVNNESNIFTIGSFLNSINNPEGLYLPSHTEILTALNAIGNGITETRVLSYQLMQKNLLWKNVLSGEENETINLARDSKINIEVGYKGPVSPGEVTKVLDNLFINFTNANTVVSGGMTFPLPTHQKIQQAIAARDGAGTTSDVKVIEYLVNGSFIFEGPEIERPYDAIVEITVRYTTTLLTQAQVRTAVVQIFGIAGFNNVTVNPSIWQ